VDPCIDPEAHATLFLGLVHGLILHAILGIGSPVDEKFMAPMKQSILNGLGIRQAPDNGREQ